MCAIYYRWGQAGGIGREAASPVAVAVFVLLLLPLHHEATCIHRLSLTWLEQTSPIIRLYETASSLLAKPALPTKLNPAPLPPVSCFPQKIRPLLSMHVIVLALLIHACHDFSESRCTSVRILALVSNSWKLSPGRAIDGSMCASRSGLVCVTIHNIQHIRPRPTNMVHTP